MINNKNKLPFHFVFQCKQKREGFTIVEVIIIIAIIGILAAISIPGVINWLPNIRLKAATRDLYANMQKAKIYAIKTNRDVTFNFTVSANCSSDTNYTFTDADGKVVAGGDLIGGSSCISASTFTNGSSGFDPRGLPAGAFGAVTMRHAKIPSRSLTISQTIAGSIRIQ